MQIRVGTINDIKGLAKVHYESWITTYTGMFSEETFKKRTYERVLENWRPRLENLDPNYRCFLAETDEGEIFAFAECGKERTGDFNIDSELYTIYMLELFHQKGIGKLLFQKVIEFLNDQGFHSLLVWVLKDNHSARKFYEKLGGVQIAEQSLGDSGILEVAYAWSNIQELNI
ncbi:MULTISPECIES: GNAT family N-acetyltransferase [Heyndrickxia]|uniref:GNAT family N-acetyltransferase n=1 Tax=Heyndrickxia TaxID=2837504 RepID=UPI001B256783|nr:GNAT family N-acetyltransferase [Heyndrickxia oleronia]GIN40205.1 acetyltransferase [Heyndrickxia oleronia]